MHTWAYGVTTVPIRLNNLLPKTLESLKRAGFDKPRLFIDGVADDHAYRHFGLETTTHYPKMRTYGTWAIALGELYLRNPEATHYLVAQDDFITYRNLRQYLEASPVPPRTYANLYSFPQNETLCPKGRVGWFPSNQRGLGAVALVFTREAVKLLLKHPHMIDRVHDPHRGHCAVDGGVLEAMRQIGWREVVHNPSLVQHTGVVSSMKHGRFPSSLTFRGKQFDALDLLKEIGTVRETCIPEDTTPPEPPPAPDREQMLAFWESGTGSDSPITDPQRVFSIHAISPRAEQKVLEVGPSGSTMLESLAEKGCEVYATDISIRRLETIKPFAKQAWLVKDLPSATFDLILCHQIAQHTGDEDLIPDLGALFNSLKHDGLLSLQFASGPAGKCGIEEQKAGKVYRTSEQVQAIVRDAGGEVLALKTSVPVGDNVTWHVFHCGTWKGDVR